MFTPSKKSEVRPVATSVGKELAGSAAIEGSAATVVLLDGPGRSGTVAKDGPERLALTIIATVA